ncbi:MAG: ABC transporter permease subunit [bacterium]|nr:ABC transporter permease subunit [bacterium]
MRAFRAILAQAEEAEAPLRIWDNAVLDEWEIPFGFWMDEMVSWVVANLETVLDVIKWPFSFLFRNFVVSPEDHPWWELTDMPWILVCGIVLVVATLTRNVRVGVGLAVMLALCGLLGNEFWEETVLTIGLVVVSVVICAIIGIPLGVLCGRVDGVWNAVRPALDAMQVVHAFVYIIPFIFFFGLGPEPATMVTMVFAIPPLIRLTNLGIRQVPADVVEASRAYGASEWRVLLDVQIPLARPAIMTGLNQTLLLSISMIGIAAIMGASGLGLLVFRAVINIDTPLSTSAGLALFIVAVVLDRISQTESGEGSNLFTRIYRAWAHRRDPEALLAGSGGDPDAAEGKPAPAGASERTWALVALIGSVVGIVSVFLPWSLDSGLISGYSRAADLDLAGLSAAGLAAEGGSYFGIAVLAMSLLTLGAALTTLTRPGRGARWFGADGALLFAGGAVISAASYLWIGPSSEAVAHQDGIGTWVALAGGLIAVVGSALWIRVAPYSPLHPLRINISFSRIAIPLVIVGLLSVAGLSPWFVDARAQSVITPELQAEIDALEKEAREDASKAGQNAITIATLVAEAQRKNPVSADGFEEKGPGLGRLALWLGVVGALFSLPAAGVFGGGERRRWMWSVAVSAIGVGVLLASGGWIASLVRASDAGFVSGFGSFLCLLAGFFLFISSRGVLKEFRRSMVYESDSRLMSQNESRENSIATEAT